jgi:hypothetical protein
MDSFYLWFCFWFQVVHFVLHMMNAFYLWRLWLQVARAVLHMRIVTVLIIPMLPWSELALKFQSKIWSLYENKRQTQKLENGYKCKNDFISCFIGWLCYFFNIYKLKYSFIKLFTKRSNSTWVNMVNMFAVKVAKVMWSTLFFKYKICKELMQKQRWLIRVEAHKH